MKRGLIQFWSIIQSSDWNNVSSSLNTDIITILFSKLRFRFQNPTGTNKHIFFCISFRLLDKANIMSVVQGPTGPLAAFQNLEANITAKTRGGINKSINQNAPDGFQLRDLKLEEFLDEELVSFIEDQSGTRYRPVQQSPDRDSDISTVAAANQETTEIFEQNTSVLVSDCFNLDQGNDFEFCLLAHY